MKRRRIDEVFDSEYFRIDEVRQDARSPQKEVIIRLNGYRYSATEYMLDRVLQKYGISIREEVAYFPVRNIDNRDMFHKSMDMMMGKKVDFSKAPSYPTINITRLEIALKANAKISPKDRGEERD